LLGVNGDAGKRVGDEDDGDDEPVALFNKTEAILDCLIFEYSLRFFSNFTTKISISLQTPFI
jgi:hypothetical protein